MSTRKQTAREPQEKGTSTRSKDILPADRKEVDLTDSNDENVMSDNGGWAFDIENEARSKPNFEPIPAKFSIAHNQYEKDENSNTKDQDPKINHDEIEKWCNCEDKRDVDNLEQAANDFADAFEIPRNKVTDALHQFARYQKEQADEQKSAHIEGQQVQEANSEQEASTEDKTQAETCENTSPLDDKNIHTLTEKSKQTGDRAYKKYLFGTVIIAALLGTICSTTYCLSNMSSRLRSMENEMYAVNSTMTDTKDTIARLDDDLSSFVNHASISVTPDTEPEDATVPAEDNHGYLGVRVMTVTEEMHESYGFPYGAYISEVISGGAADGGHLYTGDVVTAVNGAQISSAKDLVTAMENYKVDEKVKLTVQRLTQGEYSEKKATIQLGANPQTDEDSTEPKASDEFDSDDGDIQTEDDTTSETSSVEDAE